MENEINQYEYISEINVKKMQFRVISKKPQYSKQEEIKVREDMRNELYDIFKKYQ